MSKNKGFNGSSKDQNKKGLQLVPREVISEENVVQLTKAKSAISNLEITPENTLAIDLSKVYQTFTALLLDLKQKCKEEEILLDEDLFYYENLVENLITVGLYRIRGIEDITLKNKEKEKFTIAVTNIYFLLTQAAGTMSFDARQESKDYRQRINEF
ncbi:hypothetical protein [Risungbinella massiliensis]|uniref:hypothetical protein n=1 Tax=Risungbinella massiliensis TaxID=1329796 RepID=UPI0005CB8CAA|nr:hypothetical protein [Risungbinella massiliensis]